MEEKGTPSRQESRDRLKKKAVLFEDLWQKLVHVKWSQDSLVLLGQLIKDMVKTARHCDDNDVAELTLQLEEQVSDTVATGQMPTGLMRDRLEALLSELRRTLAPADAAGERSEIRSAAIALVTEIMVVAAGDEARQLVLKLGDAGFHVRHVDSLAQAKQILAEAAPRALIVDVDFAAGGRAGIEMIAELRAKAGLAAPVFFLARHGDLVTRLEAVRAGGVGYFIKPVDVSALVEKLNDPLLFGSARGCRLLILDDDSAGAQRMARTLEARGMVTEILTRPLQVLLALHRFQPDLLLLNLDLREISGKELAKVIRQHEIYSDLPIVLLSGVMDASRRQSALEAAGDDLLIKPLADDYLISVVIHRLRRARAQRARFAQISRKDTISGLYSRQHFLAQLERTLAGRGRGIHSVAVMLILLDNLRAVREATDIAAADEVMEQAARRLQRILAPHYQAARFGDAVFAVLIRNADEEMLLATARSVFRAFENEVYTVKDHSVQLRACVGISTAAETDGERNYLILVQHADLACSLAREASGERIHFYNPHADEMNREHHRLRLLEEIREAVEQERMNLVFQPIVGLRGDPTERYEIFLRMFDREGQELLPETVFAAVQQHRLSGALDRWVIAQSLRLLQERRTLDRTVILFINVSPAILRDDTLAAWLQKRLAQTQANARDLVFEVTESTARQYLKEFQKFQSTIKSLGCGLALERFGRQADSLEMIKDLPVDYVKLDGDLIRGLLNNKSQQQQLKGRVENLRSQGVTVIASGIEDLHTLPLLWICGINYVQGYFLQRPLQEMNYDFTGGVI